MLIILHVKQPPAQVLLDTSSLMILSNNLTHVTHVYAESRTCAIFFQVQWHEAYGCVPSFCEIAVFLRHSGFLKSIIKHTRRESGCESCAPFPGDS